MRVALIVPDSERSLMHRVRGSGVYADNLISSLKKYSSKDTFIKCSFKNVPKNVDIIHFLYFEPFFRTLPLIKKNKTVVTVHDLIPLVFPKNFPVGIKGSIKWKLQKAALRNCDAIITDSQCSKKDIFKYTGIDEQKVNVAYLAAEQNFKKNNSSNSAIKKKYNLPDKFVLYVGDVTWNKNLPNLIEAVDKKNLPLVLVGKALVADKFDKNNPWNQDLLKVQNLTENNINIFRLGFVENEDLVDLYNAATVFAMPSLYEGFGLPILEAMSCGCPVVTTKQGSIPEIAGNAAFYIDSYDVNSIAKGINEVFSRENLQKELSKKGLDQAKKFSWEKTAEETIAVYKKVLE